MDLLLFAFKRHQWALRPLRMPAGRDSCFPKYFYTTSFNSPSMKKIMVLFLVFLMFPLAFAVEGHMPLLAAKDVDGEYQGSPASLYLEITPGRGRVFMETFPLAKMDTQLSTRFAKDIACRYIDVDCNNYDFFYRITSDTSIIGGPSAGASIASLTASLLKGYEVDNSVAITGTINSGGFVGNVGALKAKVDAAYAANITTVLIPKGSTLVDAEEIINVSVNETNTTNITKRELNLSDYASQYNISVIEVATLDDVMHVLTGKRKEEVFNFSVDNSYADVMKKIAFELCNRSNDLSSSYKFSDVQLDNSSFNVSEIYKVSINDSQKANISLSLNDHYSAASFCYSNNIRHKFLYFVQEDYSIDEINSLVSSTNSQISKFRSLLNNSNHSTITDLQTYMIVKDRLYDAERFLDLTVDRLKINETDSALYYLATSIERLYTVRSWSSFFGSGKTEFILDSSKVKSACLLKLSEAQERFEYGRIHFPLSIIALNDELDDITELIEQEEYELCLLKSSELKANINGFMSSVSVNRSEFSDLIDVKLDAVEQSIGRQTHYGVFPILGYSYYEYASSLKENDPGAALLYAEYALELSNTDLYFEKRSDRTFVSPILKQSLLFFIGFFSGLLFAYVWFSSAIKRALAKVSKESNKKSKK